jgi:hypothetical protein
VTILRSTIASSSSFPEQIGATFLDSFGEFSRTVSDVIPSGDLTVPNNFFDVLLSEKSDNTQFYIVVSIGVIRNPGKESGSFHPFICSLNHSEAVPHMSVTFTIDFRLQRYLSK